MEGTIIGAQASRTQRVFALLVCCLMLGGAGVVYSRSDVSLPVLTAFLPIFSTTIVLTEGITSLLLAAYFRVSGLPSVAALSGAYAFTALTAALQLAVFPGVFTATGLLGAGMQTAVWIWVIWHAGFPLLILLAAAQRRFEPGAAAARRSGAVTACAAVLLGFGFSLLAIFRSSWMPLLVAHGSYARLSHGWIGIAVEAIAVLGLCAHAYSTRLRSPLDLWVGVALVAMLADVTLTLAGSSRFSLGWYAARCASLTSSIVVLAALIFETSGLYIRLARANRALAVEAALDALTGLFNRGWFDRHFEAEALAARRADSCLSVLMIDVDHFKDYNDTYGHVRGDECLRRVARALQSALRRQDDYVCRYGGEEFVVPLPNCSHTVALRIGESLRHAVRALAMPTASNPAGFVTVSVGVATTSDVINTAELIKAADVSLYRAKLAGRNRVVGKPEPVDVPVPAFAQRT